MTDHKGAVEAAKKYGRKVVVDTIGVKDRVQRAKEVTAFGLLLLSCAGLDEQTLAGYSVQTLISEGRLKVPFSIAGGVNLSTIKDVSCWCRCSCRRWLCSYEEDQLLLLLKTINSVISIIDGWTFYIGFQLFF
jgi:hypothetical protein